MNGTIFVKCRDEAERKERRESAQVVLDELANNRPDNKLLCFFDDEDWLNFKTGEATRGIYGPVDEDLYELAPEYVKEQLLLVQTSGLRVRAFDHLIYVHGSTCRDLRGLTMTFAHELQHFLQCINTRLLWAAGSLIPYLSKETLSALQIVNWADVPHEREARNVAKQVAVRIFGEESIKEFIASHLASPVNDLDRKDWEFISCIELSDSYDVAAGTHALFENLKPYRAEVEQVLFKMKVNSPFSDVEADHLFAL